jgi:DNA-binding PadR family transcriptional regulator
MLDFSFISSIIRRNENRKNKMKILSRAEELVLLSVWHLQEDAYGVAIRKHIIQRTGEDWSIGAIYVPLDRLSKQGYLRAIQGDPTPERGGRSKRYYKLTQTGQEALKNTRKIQDRMWKELPDMETDTN